MAEIDIRIVGMAGRVTLTRPDALNALSHDMCRAIDAALIAWRDDPDVRLVVLDAEGDKAFCAGGDLHDLYRTGRAGDYGYGRRFWTDEYRLNARIAEYPKPIVALMQGFTLGGGVGLGCHAAHRILCESSQISLPECGIGLVPDVGGSLILARAPGHLGEYLGISAARIGAGDAICAGFADHFIPRALWPDLLHDLQSHGLDGGLERYCVPPPEARLREEQPKIDALFGVQDLRACLDALASEDTEFSAKARKRIAQNSPLAMACTFQMIRHLRVREAKKREAKKREATIREALALEYRFSYRAMEKGDFLEGMRAAVIDKDRAPHWRHSLDSLPSQDVDEMLEPLGADALDFGDAERETL